MISYRNAVIGVFVAIGLACTGYLTIKLGRMEVFGNSGYTVSAKFTSVAGLRVGACGEPEHDACNCYNPGDVHALFLSADCGVTVG